MVAQCTVYDKKSHDLVLIKKFEKSNLFVHKDVNQRVDDCAAFGKEGWHHARNGGDDPGTSKRGHHCNNPIGHPAQKVAHHCSDDHK